MARDRIHNAVKKALVNDGWTITADPYEIEFKEVTLYIDLKADRAIAAERDDEKIAVEIKSFLSLSQIHELQAALGQYQMYQAYLEEIAPDRVLYLAISEQIWKTLFGLEAVKVLVAKFQLRLIVVNLKTEEIVLWKK
jgi:hypothetical protein